MKAYKHIPAEFADQFLNGQFLISSMDYFKFLHHDGDDEWIGDGYEGISTFRQTDDTAAFRGNPASLPWEQAELIPNDNVLSITGSSFTIVNNAYHIMCLTVSDEPNLRFYDETTESIILIPDVEQFAKALWKTGCTMTGVPIKSLFDSYQVGLVSYGSKDGPIESNLDVISGPFSKPSMFETQKELRISFHHGVSKDLDGSYPADRLLSSVQPKGMGLVKLREQPALRDPMPSLEEKPIEPHNLYSEIQAFQRSGNDYYKMAGWKSLSKMARRIMWNDRLKYHRRFQSDVPYDYDGPMWWAYFRNYVEFLDGSAFPSSWNTPQKMVH